MTKEIFFPEGTYVDLANDSSNLAEIWYRRSPLRLSLTEGHRMLEGQMMLLVKFQSGAYYAYGGVTSPVMTAIVNGKEYEGEYSLGKGFHEEVISKKDLYPYARLNREQLEVVFNGGENE